jgi:hypothetical protein
VEPWISSGIDKGARWQSEIAERLEEAKVGIVCLTSGNLTAPWILFEAGALSKTKGSHVCTFLLDVAPADVEPPLGQFQHTLFTKDDVMKLVQTINDAVKNCEERSLTDQNLVAVFDMFWPQLETQLNEIKDQPEEKPAPRPERELLEEVLEILRSQEQRIRKEREEKELTGAWSTIFPSLLPAEKEFSIADFNAVRTYLNVLRSSEKKVSDKGPTSAPMEPFKKKELSNVEPSKK